MVVMKPIAYMSHNSSLSPPLHLNFITNVYSHNSFWRYHVEGNDFPKYHDKQENFSMQGWIIIMSLATDSLTCPKDI